MSCSQRQYRKPLSFSKHSLFFSNCRTAGVLILANVGTFIYVVRMGYLPRQWILFPGNLLQGNFWPLIASGFLHSDLLHLAMNMLGIYVFGRIAEEYLGPWKTLFIYFGSLIISMLSATFIYALVLHKNVAIIGASGAVMGLIATAVLLDPFRVTYEMILPLPVMVKGWMFLYADIQGFLGGERDGVSHLAHLCGFLSVGLLVYFLSSRDQKAMRAGFIVNIISFFVFLLIYQRMMAV